MTDHDTPALTVVIPTWNGWALLQSCLESLGNQTFQDFVVIVVDDGSTDDTVAQLAAAYPEVQCIQSPVNRGFAPTANLGLAAAQSPWILLLNNDVTLEPRCLEHLMDAAATGSHSMLCPLVLFAEDPRLIYSVGDRIGKDGRPYSRGYRVPQDILESAGDPFGVSGGYGLFRKTLFDEVGLLDESFVAYYEDSDLCFRARWQGHTATLVPEAIAHHVGSASIDGRLWWRTRQCLQNQALLVVKNFSWPLLWKNRGLLFREQRHQWKRLFTTGRHHWGAIRAVLFCAGAWWGLVRRLPGALAARRITLAHRAISDEAMQKLLEGRSVDPD